MPFILPCIGIFVCLLGGFILIAYSLRHHPRSIWKTVIGFVLIVLPLWFLWTEYNFNSTLDLNPDLKPKDIIGTWHHDSGMLTFNSDGSYECKNDDECKSLGSNGEWRYEDFEIKFHAAENNNSVRRRVVLHRGKLRLTDLPGDPDAWNEKLTFEHNENH
jgi:hypothetical protein